MGYLRRHRTSYKHMPGSAPIRFAVATGLAISAVLPLAFTVPLMAQSPPTPQSKPSAAAPLSSTLPATEPTTPAPPPLPLTPSQRPPARAQITFADGTLSVSADNSSLNQILRQIANHTGMKITGGVSDERVFGHYGPAPTAQILAELLDGTDSNMILVRRDNNAEPAELILTPRQGGASPPNPNASAFDERSESQEASPGQAVQPAPAAAPRYNSNIPPANPGAPATSPANATPLESPNGIKTPQQIYEQLQRLRSQQPQQPQTPPQ